MSPNILTDTPPGSVTAGGVSYPVVTDFRDWIRFELMILCGDLSDRDKLALMPHWFTGSPPPMQYIPGALVSFYSCGRETKSSGGGARAYDFDADADRILSSFMSVYGLNLSSVSYLHWYVFRALMRELPGDCEFKRAVAARLADGSGLAGPERARLAELKKLYALPETRSRTESERSRQMLRYVHDRLDNPHHQRKAESPSTTEV